METSQSARIILDEARRMNRMVMGLLTLVRLDAGILEPKKESVDIQALLRNILEKLTPQAQSAGITLNEDLSSVPALLVDAENLTQVFVNLIENAIKYSDSGDQVQVTCSRLTDRSKYMYVIMGEVSHPRTKNASSSVFTRQIKPAAAVQIVAWVWGSLSPARW